MPNDPSAPCLAHQRMSSMWSLLHDLYGGTTTMREAGEKWLPREPKEQLAKYAIRLERSVLANYFKNTIGNHSSRPFSKAVSFKGTVPVRLETLEKDADLEGTDLTQFTRQVFESAEQYGVCHVIVDYPPNPTSNLADERKMTESGELRPYFVRVDAPDMLAWKTERRGGHVVVTEIRFKDTSYSQEGYEETKSERVRIYREKDWELWEKKERTTPGRVRAEATWEKIDFGKNTLGRVPIHTVYFCRTGFMTADPPLEDLAWMCLLHWQSSSDQRNILRFARLGLLFAAGVTEAETKKWAIGPNALLVSSDKESKLSWVEQSGRAIELGQADLADLEEKIMVFGMQPLLERFRNKTATAVMSDESRANSEIEAWAGAVESLMTECYKTALNWVDAKAELPSDFKVNIFQDYGFSLKTIEEIRALIDARKAGELSRETFLSEMKRRMMLSENLNVAEEIARIDAEGPKIEPFDNNSIEKEGDES